MVMTIRKMPVTRSSSVRTQAGGGGSACSGSYDELLSLVTLMLGSLRGGGDADISSGFNFRMRGRIVAALCRLGMGTQYMLVVGMCVLV